MARIVDRKFKRPVDRHIEDTVATLFHRHIGAELVHEPISHTESFFFVASSAAIKNLNVHLSRPFDFIHRSVAMELPSVKLFASTRER